MDLNIVSSTFHNVGREGPNRGGGLAIKLSKRNVTKLGNVDGGIKNTFEMSS